MRRSTAHSIPQRRGTTILVADTTGYNLYARTNAGHEENKAEVRKHAAQTVIAGSEEES